MGVQKRILEEKWWPGHDNYIAGIRHSSRTRENTIFDNELKAIFEKFEVLKDSFQGNDFELVLGKAAIPARDTMKNEAPTSRKGPHWVKDDDGKNRKVKPGNLARSIQIFKGKKANKSVLVGPIISKRAKVDSVEGIKKVTRRHRAYYWAFVYYGTVYQDENRFIDRAREKSMPLVKSKLKEGAKKFIGVEIDKLFR